MQVVGVHTTYVDIAPRSGRVERQAMWEHIASRESMGAYHAIHKGTNKEELNLLLAIFTTAKPIQMRWLCD